MHITVSKLRSPFRQHLLIPCFLSPGENLAREGGRLVIVKSHYEEVIVVITRVRGGAEDECNNNDNLRVQWDLTGFYPIVFDVRHITQ